VRGRDVGRWSSYPETAREIEPDADDANAPGTTGPIQGRASLTFFNRGRNKRRNAGQHLSLRRRDAGRNASSTSRTLTPHVVEHECYIFAVVVPSRPRATISRSPPCVKREHPRRTLRRGTLPAASSRATSRFRARAECRDRWGLAVAGKELLAPGELGDEPFRSRRALARAGRRHHRNRTCTGCY
jgi:hypothetical protein